MKIKIHKDWILLQSDWFHTKAGLYVQEKWKSKTQFFYYPKKVSFKMDG
jgi:hypothetical protein